MEPPQIRIHRYEHTVAIKWPEHECWWVVDPNSPSSSGYAAPSATFDGPDAREWFDPTVSQRDDVSTWTTAIRRDLAGIEQTLRGLERHPFG